MLKCLQCFLLEGGKQRKASWLAPFIHVLTITEWTRKMSATEELYWYTLHVSFVVLNESQFLIRILYPHLTLQGHGQRTAATCKFRWVKQFSWTRAPHSNNTNTAWATYRNDKVRHSSTEGTSPEAKEKQLIPVSATAWLSTLQVMLCPRIPDGLLLRVSGASPLPDTL